jgi:DNA-binding MarR family transcriptional regulator
MNSVFSPVGENFGLTMMQTRILMELHQYESHTIGSLADSVCVAGANVSNLCKRLENQGLLERVRNREDERVVRVLLTEVGKETVLEIDNLFNDKIAKHLMNETEETFEDIILGLQKLNELLQRMNNTEQK